MLTHGVPRDPLRPHVAAHTEGGDWVNVQRWAGPGKSPLVNKHEGTYEVPHVHDRAAPDDMFGH
jgi:hypothetical protein